LKLDNNWGIVVFATRRIHKTLSEVKCLYIDGTFRTAPQPYAQMVSIHGDYHNFIIPLAFCLLNGKTVGQYRQVLQVIKCAVFRATGRQLQPDKVVCDFEKGLMMAVETEFPNTRIAGCYFHFTQSLWRHLQDLGLARAYRRDEQFRKFVRRVMAIAFLPLIIVRHKFLLLRQSRTCVNIQLQFPPLNDWLDYIHLTYIQPTAMFPPTIWNVYTRTINTQTNNCMEGRVYHFIQSTYNGIGKHNMKY
jgi:MULE transposase domain